MPCNIGNALLVIGALYLHYVYGMDSWGTVVLVSWGLLTWVLPGFDEEREEFLHRLNMLLRELELLARKLRTGEFPRPGNIGGDEGVKL